MTIQTTASETFLAHLEADADGVLWLIDVGARLEAHGFWSGRPQ